MPVYNKCKQIDTAKLDTRHQLVVASLKDAVVKGNKESLYEAVVEFIEWYNDKN